MKHLGFACHAYFDQKNYGPVRLDKVKHPPSDVRVYKSGQLVRIEPATFYYGQIRRATR